MQLLYKLFGRITKDKLKHYVKTRLIYYVIALLILLVGGVKSLVITTFIVISFFLGWTVNKMITAFKDYRLTQRLNRIHFTAIEYDQMQRERDLAISAFKTIAEKTSTAPKGAMERTPGRYSSQSVRMSEGDIREFMAQNGMEMNE